MSLESQVAALVLAAGNLLQLPQTIATTAQEQIAAVSLAYQNAIARADIQKYVSQSTGLDTNAGTQSAPYRTINRALADCVPGGLLTVILMSDYNVSEHIRIFNKRLRVASFNPASPAVITFNKYGITAENVRAAYRFTLEGDAYVSLLAVRIVVPNSSGYTAFTRDFRSAIIGPPDGASDSIFVRQAAGLLGCTLDIPSDNLGAVISGPMVQLYASNLTIVGQSILGRLIDKYTNTAGTTAAAAPDVFTNLPNF
ncbi:hypothetical protein [Methylobacterium oryzihabitans]|uniref:Uncharacterized protein n=1 Tax=Methylobacterium oryzihabitans TaxID=2499852 RepID=A0A3S2YKK8_9HYPH|nr:hypothetical protein [Methylobacterium oryzihabitans]RVU13168.1 hypothetical protein EOE48_27040 [Methylobacterium oryzihabitans]